jgi:hypothetical protein
MGKFRKIVLEIFSEKKSLRKSDLTHMCKAKLGEEIPNNIYTKIMRELAHSKGSIWVIVLN